MTRRILRNSAECAHCGTVIVSRTVHDFQRCHCGAIFVDGGNDYIRRGGDLKNCIDRTEYDDVPQSE